MPKQPVSIIARTSRLVRPKVILKEVSSLFIILADNKARPVCFHFVESFDLCHCL